MPILNEGQRNQFFVIEFDDNGDECQTDVHADGQPLSEKFAKLLNERTDVTDVFVMSHGWLGDVPGSTTQYNSWINAMLSFRDSDKDTSSPVTPLVVGLHWHSCPLGDEDYEKLLANLNQGGSEESLEGDESLDVLAKALVDTPSARAAYAALLRAAQDGEDLDVQLSSSPQALPPGAEEDWLSDKLQKLKEWKDRVNDGLTAVLDDLWDRLGKHGRNSLEAVSALLTEVALMESGQLPSSGEVIKSCLKLLSFYRMKEFAAIVGARGGFKFLNSLLRTVNDRPVRFHLMGHSFGCIVVSAMLAGDGKTALARNVDSLILVQGALSLWSYCNEIPGTLMQEGRFHQIVQRVNGPIVTTQSENDFAVRKCYPVAVAALDEERYRTKSIYDNWGALGTHGARGLGIPVVDLRMLPLSEQYRLAPKTIHNVESSRYIRKWLDMWSGAHCDIDKLEVAQLVWQAAMASPKHRELIKG